MRFVVATGLFSDRVFASVPHREGLEISRADLRDPAAVPAATAGAEGVVVVTNPLTADHISALPDSVKVIGRAGIGLDAIDLDAAADRGVAVIHLPDYATTEVADHTAALILTLARRIPTGDRVAREAWADWSAVGSLRSLGHTVIGVVGAGRIGRGVLQRLHPFGPELVVYDPAGAAIEQTVSVASSVDELLERSDVVSLHLPLTDDTRGLIGARELALMPAGGALVNVSRGGLVDHDALAEALTSGHLSGAGLDVLDEEPPRPDAAILRAPNVILTPHVAWYSEQAEQRLRDETLQSMQDYVAGRPISHGRLAVAPA